MAVSTTTTADTPFDRASRAFQRRWWILGVLCFSLLVIVVDNSILNVALPELQTSLHASNSELQWMVDSYTLVFAGLLLSAGTLGDKFGRRGALQLGMTVFGVGSLLSAFAGTPHALILTRGLMGIGGAFIMPATLSIITNVFPPEERGRAIAFWAAVAGVGTAVGPISGGILLSHFYWGSVFLVNLPIVAFALLSGFFLIPTSKDPTNPRLDVVGALLSVVGLMSLVYAIIEAPQDGWGSSKIVAAFALSAVVLALFAWWEGRFESPMLDVSFFKNPRFTAASSGISLIFFAMFGSMFLLTQYFQFVMLYSPLRTGLALLPIAVTMMIVAPTSARIVERVGTKMVVATGLALTAIALASFAVVPAQHIDYMTEVFWRLVIMAAGMGLVMAPATESIMGSLPRAKAGVGSAVNDTTRQVGGALGVAVIGSVMTSTYGSHVAKSIAASGVHGSADDIAGAKEGLGFALELAAKAPAALQAKLVTDAQAAFVSGMHEAVIFGAVAAALGAIIVAKWLPARAAAEEAFEEQEVDEVRYEHEQAKTGAGAAAAANATDDAGPDDSVELAEV
ncbi:MAG TPA: MFS transporter [Acidimicrobiia bacterium]|jgi:EmrB/QacA subfamily drug resistance transporter